VVGKTDSIEFCVRVGSPVKMKMGNGRKCLFVKVNLFPDSQYLSGKRL